MKTEVTADIDTLVKALREKESSLCNDLPAEVIRDKIFELELIESTNIRYKTGYTGRGHLDRHGRNVMTYTDGICKLMGMPDGERHVVAFAARWHDIGKSKVPGELEMKDGKYTEGSWAELKKHAGYSGELIQPLTYPARIAKYHHRNVDGTGYPEVAEGDEVPPASAIIHVTDVFDAMTARSVKYKNPDMRNLRKADDGDYYVHKDEFVIGMLKRRSGTEYDAEIVEYLEKVLKGKAMEYRLGGVL